MTQLIHNKFKNKIKCKSTAAHYTLPLRIPEHCDDCAPSFANTRSFSLPLGYINIVCSTMFAYTNKHRVTPQDSHHIYSVIHNNMHTSSDEKKKTLKLMDAIDLIYGINWMRKTAPSSHKHIDTFENSVRSRSEERDARSSSWSSFARLRRIHKSIVAISAPRRVDRAETFHLLPSQRTFIAVQPHIAPRRSYARQHKSRNWRGGMRETRYGGLVSTLERCATDG